MKKGAKTLGIFLAAVFAVSAAACQKFTSDPADVPVYPEAEPFRFVAYMGPPPANSGDGAYSANPDYMTLENYQIMADCGFNYTTGMYENTQALYLKGMDLAAQVGMKYYVRDYSFYDGCIEGIIQGAKSREDAQAQLAAAQSSIEARFDEYASHPGFAGVLAIDEPSALKFDAIAVLNEWWEENYAEYEFQVNLLPTYSQQNQLFGDNTSTKKYDADYVGEFNELVDPSVLSYDHYALSKSGTNYVLSDTYLRNLEIFAEEAKETDKEFYVFLLTLGHWNFRTMEYYRDIAWQVYTAMAYGAVGAQTFTYWTNLTDDAASNISGALVDRDGEKLPAWYAMQQVTQEVRAMEQTYMNFDWVGTMPVVADEYEGNVMFDYLMNPMTEHERIASAEATNDAIIGAFKDGEGRDGFMIANLTDPILDEKASVTVKFNDTSKVVVYKKGRTFIYPANRGEITFELGSGEGWFVIPLQ